MTLVLRLSLDDCGAAEERVVPPEAWCEEGDVVRVHGVGLVQGGHGVKRVPVRRTTMLSCQRCHQLNVEHPLVLWVRHEGALGRDMYWFGLGPGPRRYFCGAPCLPFSEDT